MSCNMSDTSVDIPFGSKVEALIRSSGLDPDLMEMCDFSVRAPWIFYAAWMSFHPELKRARTLKFFGDSRNADDIGTSMSEHDSNEVRVQEVIDGVCGMYTDLLKQAEEEAAAVDPARPLSAAAASTRTTPNLLQPVLNTAGTKVGIRSEAYVKLRRNLKIMSRISVKAVCTGEPQALGEMVAVLFQEGQRLWESASEVKTKAPAPVTPKRLRPKSASATSKAQSLSRLAYLVPSPTPGVPTRKDVIETKKKEAEALLNAKRVENGRTCDVPTNPYIKHLTVEAPPTDLTLQSNVNRMKLRIAIIKNMRQNSPERSAPAPSTRTSAPSTVAAASTMDSAAQETGGPEDQFGSSAAEAFPLREHAEVSGFTAGAGTGTGPPSPIVSPPKKIPIGGPAPDLEYGQQYHGFGAFLLDKLRKKAKGRTALDEQQEAEKASEAKSKKKKRKKSKARGALQDMEEAITLLGPAIIKKKASDEHFAKMQEKMKQKDEENSGNAVTAKLAERKAARGPGRMSIMESKVKGGVFKPGAEVINITTQNAKNEGTWMGGVAEESSSSMELISEPSVTIFGGGIKQVVKNIDITGGKLLHQRKLDKQKRRPGSAPASRSSKDGVFSRLFTDACLIPKDTDVMNPDFLRSLGIDETHDLFMSIHGKPPSLRNSGSLPITVDGAPALLTYDTVTGRKVIITPDEQAQKEADWKARNTMPTDAEMANWTREVDRIWSIPGTLKPPEIIRTQPTKAQWPGFNTGQRTNEWVHRARRDVLTEKFSQVGGKQTTHTTNHALSTHAIRTAKLVKDAQASSDFYALTSQTMPLDLLITIEHCHSCSQHAMHSKHDERQYVSMANAFLRTLVEVAHAEKICCRVGVCRFDSVLRSEGEEGEHHSRIGSFEIQVIYHTWTGIPRSKGASESGGVVSEILHSKLTSQRWPAKSVVEKRFKAFLNRFNVPVRDPALPATAMLAKTRLRDGGSDGTAVYPVGPMVAIDDVKVAQDKWEFVSNSLQVVDQPLNASPQLRAAIRRDIQQAADQKVRQEAADLTVALAEDLEMRKKEQTGRFLEEKERLRETKTPSKSASGVLGDPRMLSAPKGPGGGARSYISGSPSHLRGRPSSPTDIKTASPSIAKSPAKLPDSRLLDVQWAFDCREASRLKVYRPGDVTYVLGVRHPRGGIERHAIPAEVISVQETKDPGAECKLTVRLKYHESTLQVSSNDCVAYRSANGPADRAYARDSVPTEFSLLLHLLSAGPSVWKALHPGDTADPDSKAVYLTRSSFFHQVRNAAAQAEAADSRGNSGDNVGKVVHPLTGDALDLQLAYGEGTLNWAFGQSGDKVDMTALAHLAHLQYLRQESEMQLAEQLVLQKLIGKEGDGDSVGESKSSDLHHTAQGKLHIDAPKVTTNTLVGLISPRATQEQKTSPLAQPPRHKDRSPRALKEDANAIQKAGHVASEAVHAVHELASAAVHTVLHSLHLDHDSQSQPMPAKHSDAASASASAPADAADDDYGDDYGEDEWDAPTPVKPHLEESQMSGGDASGSSQENLTAVSSSGSQLPTAKDHTSVSIDSNRTEDARHDASGIANTTISFAPAPAVVHGESILHKARNAAGAALHQAHELEKAAVHAVAQALHLDHAASQETLKPTSPVSPTPVALEMAPDAKIAATPVIDLPLDPISENSPRLLSQLDGGLDGSIAHGLGLSAGGMGMELSHGRNLEVSQASLLSESSKPPTAHYPGQEPGAASHASVSFSNFLPHSGSQSSEEMNNEDMMALVKKVAQSPPNTPGNTATATAPAEPASNNESPSHVHIVRETSAAAAAAELSPESSIDTPPGLGIDDLHGSFEEKVTQSLPQPQPDPAEPTSRKIDFENSAEEGADDYAGDADWD